MLCYDIARKQLENVGFGQENMTFLTRKYSQSIQHDRIPQGKCFDKTVMRYGTPHINANRASEMKISKHHGLMEFPILPATQLILM